MIDATVIIQARMGSKRFPGKMLADLCGKPVIEHVIDRVLDSGPRVVAIPDTPENVPLAHHIENEPTLFERLDKNDVANGLLLRQVARLRIPVRLFRGNESDVLRRFSDAATWAFAQYGATAGIVRITGDCPLVDHWLIGELFQTFRRSGMAYVGQTNDPDGSDVEVFSYDALMRSNEMAKEQRQREHVTTYMRECMNGFINPSYCSTENVKFSVDTPADLARCAELIRKCGVNAGWRKYMEALQ
jgi:spore coat polysaccharide biosynthesis protein SpsF (cytidylyltransferase family)